MTSTEPLIKIIPPNPVSHSILIVYCYTNNKTIQCQAKWSRIQPNQQNLENKNNRSTNNQTGNTYKCSPLDCNYSILVQATCQFMGKTYKLTSKTQPVKASKQLLDKKNHQKTVNCKISNSNLQIQCKIGLDFNKTLLISSGSKIFNLQLQTSHVYVLSSNIFKARILSHRYQFLTFFHQCQNQKQNSNYKHQLSLANLFQFTFSSQSDRDLVLLKISQNTQINNEKIFNFVNIRPKVISSHQQLPPNNVNFLQHAHINIDLKSKDHHFESLDRKNSQTKRSNADKSFFQTHKKEFTLNFQTPENKSLSSFFYYSPKANQKERKQTGSQTKKNQKIKISQKISQKYHKDSFHDMNSRSHHDLKTKQEFNNINEKTPSILNEKRKQQDKKGDKQFLNIFDEQGIESDSLIVLQNSSPEFYKQGSLKNRSLTNFIENKINSQKKDLPSINLRGSFDQLEKHIEPLQNQNIKQKFKTQTCRQLGYQYTKSNQQPEFFNTPSNEYLQNFNEDPLKLINQLKKENQDLKKQNLYLRIQLESFDNLSQENLNFKKKNFELTQKINILEKQIKEIHSDKLKYESFYHKEKVQKESIRRQLQDVFNLIEKNSFQQLLKLTKQKKQVSNKINELQEQIFNKVGCQTLKNIGQTKRYFVNEGRVKTPSNKMVYETQKLLTEQNKLLNSNSQSRKELLFPNYSYKYNSTNKNLTIS